MFLLSSEYTDLWVGRASAQLSEIRSGAFAQPDTMTSWS